MELNGHTLEQLKISLLATLNSWFKHTDRDSLKNLQTVECFDYKYIEKIPEAERYTLKLTVKLFVCNVEPELMRQAVDRVCLELGVTKIDLLLLSMPEKPFEEDLTIEHFKPLWIMLETLVDEGKIEALGVSDLDKIMLEQLFIWSKVKPSINQVNLQSCCVMPPEMTEFAKENEIQLLTHSDPKEILPPKVFRDVLSETCHPDDGANWFPSWILRYSVLIKQRGIIKTKGYIVKSQRLGQQEMF
ncbi:glutamate--cysteine ligase regulatory subunit-like [Saccoglossus kowalevskii]|uniref:GCS light chain n=1 Tax=Saccoglossus kowalevskii TaxID=10224 RepID=A0ABM0GKU2_SACKO|nr:PREDICTED: glutamate--cysteine ligase regulatory subunit-like [Saccoglossus kowalevskii]